jgi:hypothetical protein
LQKTCTRLREGAEEVGAAAAVAADGTMTTMAVAAMAAAAVGMAMTAAAVAVAAAVVGIRIGMLQTPNQDVSLHQYYLFLKLDVYIQFEHCTVFYTVKKCTEFLDFFYQTFLILEKDICRQEIFVPFKERIFLSLEEGKMFLLLQG